MQMVPIFSQPTETDSKPSNLGVITPSYQTNANQSNLESLNQTQNLPTSEAMNQARRSLSSLKNLTDGSGLSKNHGGKKPSRQQFARNLSDTQDL